MSEERTDHIWFRDGKDRWKCCLCGGVYRGKKPPPFPTPKEFIPDTFELLTDEERAVAPFSLTPGRKDR